LQCNGSILSDAPISVEETLPEKDYRVICKALLNWWSTGVINIEILDGERFNEEIFIGL